MGKQEIERLRELREPYACMAASHEGEAEGAKFAEIVAALDRAIAIAEAWEVAPEGATTECNRNCDCVGECKAGRV